MSSSDRSGSPSSSGRTLILAPPMTLRSSKSWKRSDLTSENRGLDWG
ncbi:mitogen-activated protein kinase kinase kinase NPK1-like isoform X1 [Iris pallida]|uniref:Mitogen-activated protein kinase kinase kinase NPK1-like isoform X1 n=1 Tax=Iris pallida TaxID=29817 RepID=A0AAX6GCS1_IRIPA|nr:mitogen-activated protein kinase kinase kinase NPK1-like isoform X1 [Iris pallida]